MTVDQWRKSSYSKGVRQNCVECCTSRARVHVRDTQNRNDGHLSFPVVEWRAFLAEVDEL